MLIGPGASLPSTSYWKWPTYDLSMTFYHHSHCNTIAQAKVNSQLSRGSTIVGSVYGASHGPKWNVVERHETSTNAALLNRECPHSRNRLALMPMKVPQNLNASIGSLEQRAPPSRIGQGQAMPCTLCYLHLDSVLSIGSSTKIISSLQSAELPCRG